MRKVLFDGSSRNRRHAIAAGVNSGRLDRFAFRTRRVAVLLPRQQEQKPHTGANRGVGQIERRETNFAGAAAIKIEAQEIDDVTVPPKIRPREIWPGTVSASKW
jgi:hypothetical protein